MKNSGLIMKMIQLFMDTCAQYRHSIVHRGSSFNLPEADETTRLLDEIALILINDIHQAKTNKFVEEFKENNIVTKSYVVNKVLTKNSHLVNNLNK